MLTIQIFIFNKNKGLSVIWVRKIYRFVQGVKMLPNDSNMSEIQP